MSYDLSIVIPAGKEEEFTARTVEDILKNKRGNTEIIVVADGWWPEPGLEDHKDVRMIRLAEPIGQRAAQNLGVKLSRAKYVMKMDCHCSVEEGFDQKMLDAFKEVGDNVTMVPLMRNLHVFDWVCEHCEMRVYQGPEPDECRNETCTFDEKKFKKEVVWIPKQSPQSTAYRFNKDLRFKYFPELRRRQKGKLVETMSLQGSCFMATRENYWKLKLCDESWGGWGQQGSEVALKTWLSGGQVLCNTDTWYAHLFRTQKGFSHPWGNPGSSQHNAIKTSQDMFFNNKWDQQVRPLSWLLERFWTELKEIEVTNSKLPEGQKDPAVWTEDDLKKMKKVPMEGSKGILYYTTNRLPIKFAKKVQNNLKEMGLPITSVSLKPMQFGRNIHIPLQPGKWAYFTQILAGLENAKEDIIFMAEHDVMYSKEHFDFTPPEKDTVYYNQNWWKVRDDGFAVHWDAEQVSGLVAYRETLIDYYRGKIDEILEKGFDRHYEPKAKFETWKSKVPYLDYRQAGTMTKDKWSLKDFRKPPVNWQEGTVNDIPGWKDAIV